MDLKLFTTIMLCANLCAQETPEFGVSAPIGSIELTFSAESDTPFSIPMNRGLE